MKFYYETNRDGGDNNNGNQTDNDNSVGEPLEFASVNDWYESLKDDQKTIANPIKSHFERMHQSVKDTRDERDALEGRLKDAVKALKDGADKDTFQSILVELDETKKRASFMEEASSHKCINAKAAYLIAKSSDLFDKKGNPDWQKIEETAPEFFGEKKQPLPRKGAAGGGTDEPSPVGKSMNDWIRQQAGKNKVTQ